MILNSNQKHFAFLLIALFIIVLYYLKLISDHPYFLTDDYLNFGIIKLNYSNFISFNLSEVSSYEKFYFYTRPITYLISLMDIKFFSENPFQMKLFSLLLNSILIIALFYLLKEVSAMFVKKISGIAILITLLLFGLHPNNMWWIYWISDQNEMIMILFYIVSLFSVIRYINTSEKKYLVSYLLFYVFSIFTKQQPLHLPVMVLIIAYYFKNNFSTKQFWQIKVFSIYGIAIMTIYSFFTYINSTNDFKFEYLLKKPFSLGGNLLYVIFPYNSLANYEYATEHKLVVYLLVSLIIILTSILIYFKYLSFKVFTFSLLILVVSFYPRLIDGANNRINTIQVLLFCILIFIAISSKFNFRKYVISGVLIIIVLNCYETNAIVSYYKSLKNLQLDQATGYNEGEYDKKTAIIAFWSHLLPYQLHFIRNKAFGKDDISILPFSYSILNSGKEFTENIKIECLLKNGNIGIRNFQEPDVRIDLDNFNINSGEYKHLQNDVSYDKGFKELTFPVSGDTFKEKFIYFDGRKWVNVN
ncbi:hypothetical protein BH10BAC5_BH10BAC5_14490 [soil metagenome]